MKLFLDITRIVYRLTGTTPTGIDRVEFAYASRILRDDAYKDCVFVLTAPFFTGALRRDLMLDLLDRIERAWRADMRAEDDPIYRDLVRHLGSPPATVVDSVNARRRFRNAARLRHLRTNMIYPLRDLIRSPARLDRWTKRAGSESVVYLNTSHNQLETPQRLAWAKPPVRNVFFVHDTIPIDYPEFVAAVSPGRHQRRMKTVAAMSSLVILNSTTTRAFLESHLRRENLPVPPTVVVPLGVAESFLRVRRDLISRPPPPMNGVASGSPSSVIEQGDRHPYFVTLSTIEPRKNLLFLFAVWRRLAARHGSRTPRLVVAGQRGWENENIADVLERSRDLAPYLVEVSDLCDDAVARLLAGAAGLLQPSSVEGFGLPLIEGMTVGTPVVASDIAAHREVAAGHAELIDPIDGPAWLAAVERLFGEGAASVERRAERARRFTPLAWPDHVDRALDAILELDRN